MNRSTYHPLSVMLPVLFKFNQSLLDDIFVLAFFLIWIGKFSYCSPFLNESSKHVRPKISLTGEPAYVHRGISPADMTIDRVQLCYQLHIKNEKGFHMNLYKHNSVIIFQNTSFNQQG